jgi:hypothetical protein
MFYQKQFSFSDPLATFVEDFYPMTENDTNRGFNRVFLEWSNPNVPPIQCAVDCYFKGECDYFGTEAATGGCRQGRFRQVSNVVITSGLWTYHIRDGMKFFALVYKLHINQKYFNNN